MSEQPRDSSRGTDKIRCDACPVLCYIADGAAGACDRYANRDGELFRVDPLTLLEQAVDRGDALIPFAEDGDEPWDGNLVGGRTFVTGVGAGSTYPDFKPAPFIVSQDVDGIDMITVVTEGIYSYCGVKVKIDTDHHVGPERAPVRSDGQVVGHVTTAEYGSQMLSLGGVDHLTGGSKAEGRATCDTLLRLCNREAVDLSVEGGANVTVQAGKPPVFDGQVDRVMRVGCGSAAIGIFGTQWQPHVDEVVVVDDHITGVLSEHQAGRMLGMEPSGIYIKGRRSTPGRYFQVADKGAGWGGTTIENPLDILGEFNPRRAHPGMTLLMVSTTGEHSAYFVLDDDLQPMARPMPEALLKTVERVRENCEPALCSVVFMAGAGGSLRAGVTENPVNLTRSVRQSLTHVTCGGAPAYIWPGGGITLMVDVMAMPLGSFGYVPTPAIVAPIEFTLRRGDYAALGGHMNQIRPLAEIQASQGMRREHAGETWPLSPRLYPWSRGGDR